VLAAVAVNLILEPVRPPVVATDAPASPFKFTMSFAAVGINDFFAPSLHQS
jgi:hypothetical protein